MSDLTDEEQREFANDVLLALMAFLVCVATLSLAALLVGWTP